MNGVFQKWSWTTLPIIFTSKGIDDILITHTPFQAKEKNVLGYDLTSPFAKYTIMK